MTVILIQMLIMPRSREQGWGRFARQQSAKRIQERKIERILAALPYVKRCQAQGMSLAAIAKALNAFGIPSPGAGTGYGDNWTRKAVERILAKEDA